MNAPLNQEASPTDEQRHEMLRTALERAGRLKDYDYIVRYLSPPPDITNFAKPGEMKGIKIGILGGGLAGMCSAFELRKLGADITVLEASETEIGGRVSTYYFNEEGSLYGELGAMRIPISHETTWHYINLFQLDTFSLTAPQRNNFLYVHQTRLRTAQSVQEYIYPKFALTEQEAATPWNELNEYAMEYRMRQLTPEVRAELIQILPEYSPEFIPLMNMSLRQNYEGLGLSQGAIELISGVDPAAGASLHISYDEIAGDDYSLDYRNTYRIAGGNIYLPYALYQSLTSALPKQYSGIPKGHLGTVDYRAGHRVTGIYRSNYRDKVIVKYSNEVGLDAADFYDYVICTLPLSVLRTIEIRPYFTNRKMQAIREYHYIDAQKTLFLCNKRFWERNTDYGAMHGGISFTDLPIQSIIYPSDHNYCISASEAAGNTVQGNFSSCSSEVPGVLTASYSLTQNSVRVGGLEEPQRFDLIRQNVEEVHGLPRGFLNSIVDRSVTAHWNTAPHFLGALSYTLPGQKQLFTYDLLQPEYQGRVYLAGEHASAKHGWIQGALYSGKDAANRLAQHFHTRFLKDELQEFASAGRKN